MDLPLEAPSVDAPEEEPRSIVGDLFDAIPWMTLLMLLLAAGAGYIFFGLYGA